MAEQYDGDIKIGVTLDPKDVKKSAEDLSKAVKKTLDQSAGKNITTQMKSIEASMAKVVDQVGAVHDKMSQLEEASVVPENIKKEYNDLADVLADNVVKLDGINEQMREAGEAISKDETLTNAVKRFMELGQQMEELEHQISLGDAPAEAARSLEEIRVEYDELKNYIDQHSPVLKLQADATQIEQNIQEIREQLKSMEVSGTETEEYQRLKIQLAEYNNQLRVLKARHDDAVKSAKKHKQQNNKLLSVFQKLGSVGASALNKLKESIKDITKEAPKMNNMFNFKKLALFALGVASIRQVFQKLKNAIKEGLTNMAQWNGGMNSANSAISQLQSSLNYLKNAWGAAFAPILSYVAPILSRLIDMLATAANYIGAFFAALTGKSTFTKAKKVMTNYAQSVGGATKAVKDQKKAEEDLQDELKEKLGSYDKLEVIQDDNAKAAKDLADAADDAGGGGAADPFAGMFEDVNIDETLPQKILDWINRLKEAWANEEWRKVGNIIAEGLNAGMLIVDNWFNDTLRPFGTKWAAIFAEIGNGIVEALDWELLGKTIADGFNAIIDIILSFTQNFDWYELGAGVGHAISSWFENIEWDQMGTFFSESWRILIELIAGIVENVNWEAIGSGISEFITSWFDNIPWDTLASAVSTGINGVITALQTALDETDWAGMAAELGQSISDLWNGIDWEGLGHLASTGFNTVITIFDEFISNIDWKQSGANLFAGISQFIIDIDWGNIGETIGDLFIAAVDLLAGFIEGTDWGGIIDSLFTGFIDLVTSVDWLEVANSLANLLVQAILAVFEIGASILTNLWEGLKTAFEYVGEMGIEGLLQGIEDALVGISTWLYEHLIKPIVDGVKELFGISSPSTVFSEIGGYLIDGLLNGLKNTWESITEFFGTALEGLKTLLGGAWDKIKETAGTAWDTAKGVGSKIIDGFGKAKEKVVEFAGDIKEKVGKKWEDVKSNATKAWDTATGIGSKVMEGFGNAKNKVIEAAGDIKEEFADKWRDIKSNTKTKWNDLKTDVVGTMNDLKTKVLEKMDSVKSKLAKKWGEVSTTAQDKIESMKTNVQDKFDNLKENLMHKVESFTSIGTQMANGIKNGISDMWDSVMSTARRLADGVKSVVNRVLDINSPSKVMEQTGKFIDEGLEIGIRKNGSSVLSEVANLADQVTEEFSMPDIVSGKVVPSSGQFASALASAVDISNASNGEASASHSPIILQLNGRQIAEVVWDEQEKKYKQYNGYIPRFA